ncbi:unnamed protein product [Meloidogyne enterolobii]|uniref:Uncharacterized protein n=1 Tax=Meloidogyne enterolobii TaxID=390850 RepID=A0ACB0YIX2_MELEN
MARPTERTFNEFNLIEQFKKEKIKTLINLQCVNEHDFCGPQLITHTGFSYDPEILMSRQIYYYNFGIPDFGTISVHSILNIAKVIWFSLKKGRVAIHCHAGLGRTGTLIACFLVWAKGISTSEAIDFVRNARPNSVQSLEQINAVEEFSYHVYKNGTALPNSLFISNNGMISLRQLMTRQRQFLPNEQARRFAHIPKLLYMLGDNLLRMVFGPQGIYYAPLTDKQHHARSCTFGTIHVNWRNAFTPKGKLQVRQVVNLFARCSAFPYEKDQNLIGKFQQISLVTIDSLIKEMDISQLISLLNAFLESIKRPYCSRRVLIEVLGQFSPDNPIEPINTQLIEENNKNEENLSKNVENETIKQINENLNLEESKNEEEEKEKEEEQKEMLPSTSNDNENEISSDNKEIDEITKQIENKTLINVMLPSTSNDNGNEINNNNQEIDGITKQIENKTLINLPSTSIDNGNEISNDNQEIDEITKQIENKTPINEISDEAAKNGRTSLDEEQNLNVITELPNKNKLEKNSKLSISAGNSIERPTTMDTEYDSYYDNNNEFYLFDIQDLHTNKDANLYADWQCIVFYVCNILRENYDSVVDLLTFWFAGDSNRDVKQAIYCHMRDLFARNMRQQEQQATAWRQRMGLPERLKN